MKERKKVWSNEVMVKIIIKGGPVYIFPENDEYPSIILSDNDELIVICHAIYKLKKLL